MNNIEKLLSDKYCLNITSITDAPRGFVAKTYIVNTEDNRYFLKVLKKNRYSLNVIQSLPILKELKEFGIDYINYPIETTDSDLYIEDGDKYLILFNYIEGKNTFDYDLIEAYKKIIQIHKQTEKIDDFLIKFDLSLVGKYKDLEIIRTYIEEIFKHWKIFNTLSKKLANADLKMYLTHGDAFGNIIMNVDKLSIIDWDDLILAPLERDVWFFADNEEVIKIYSENFNNFEVNIDVVKYYVYYRFFDDLVGFLELLEENPKDKEIEKIIKDIEKDCINWTYRLIENYQ
jgi:fructosamine-3-kinase